MLIRLFYSPLTCYLIPSIVVDAGTCDRCPDIHAYQITIQALFWGVSITINLS